jgi:hypothetical protein
MQVVRVQFPSGPNNYDYFAPPGDKPEIGDFIITSFEECVRNRFNGFEDVREPKFATVIGLAVEGAKHKATKPYLMLVSKKLLHARKVLRDQIMAVEVARKDARTKLKQMIEDQAEMQVFENLAKTNPEAAQLLEILRRPAPQAMLDAS